LHQDLFSLPPGQLIELPDGLDDKDAVFLAHMETAVSILHDASPLIGETALVLGQGTIGLLVSELLVRSGVRVISVEPSKIRRQASERIGCTCLSPLNDQVVEEVLGLTKGRGADLAINVTGSDRALQTGIDSLGMEARLVETSWYGARDARLALGLSFHRRRLKLISSQVSTLSSSLSARWDKARRIDMVIDLLDEIGPSRYISRSFPLDDAARAYELIDRDPKKVIQVVLTP
jgi:threonine dehydrogenase-like Zn-dependent dehydrogenase